MSLVISGDAATTRTNLGLGNAATLDAGTAAGEVAKLDSSGNLQSPAPNVIEVRADATTSFWVGTQAQYDAISTPDSNTLYFITG